MSKNKLLLIIERSNNKLTINKSDNDYVLEGVFTEFGVKNNNDRIYEEKEFLPHLESLQEQIKNGTLYGELDHPEKFDVSLDKVSHIIESLEYVPSKRQVVGKIKLVDTVAGKNAKAIMDAGGKLSISSRAAGTVNENKKVSIKKVFTYDLVANPGFSKAQLERVNESLGFSDNDLDVYDVTDNDSFIYTIAENNLRDNSYLAKNENKKDIIKSMNEETRYVDVESLEKYSLHIENQIETIEEKLKEKDDVIKKLETSNDLLKEYVEYVNKSTVEATEKIIEYSDYIAENVKNTIDYSEYIAENVKNNIDYSEYIAENVKNNIDYSEYIAEESTVLTEYLDVLAEGINDSIKYSEYVAEKVHEVGEFGEYIAENVKNNIDYSEYIAENVKNNIDYSEYIAENVKNNIDYSEYIAESVSGGKLGSPSITKRYNLENLNENIDLLLETAKKKKAEKNNDVKETPYFTLLSESKKREFQLLENDKKQIVISKVKEVKPITEGEFLQVWDIALNVDLNKSQAVGKLLENMPEKLKGSWENLNENDRNKILAQAEFYNLSTPYQMKDFWNSRQTLTNAKELQRLNESVVVNEETNTKSYGKNEYMNHIANSLDRYNFIRQ